MFNLSKIKILNIDDNDNNRCKNSNILQQAGFAVKEAKTSKDAVEILKRDRPQLVLLNVELSEQQGLSLCQQIKTNPATANIIVVHLYSHLNTNKELMYGLEFGADSYLSEPIDPKELIATVNALLRMQQAHLATRYALKEWQTTFDSLTVGVSLLDLQGKVLRCNQAFARILAKEFPEIIGYTFPELLNGVLDPFEVFPTMYRFRGICCERTHIQIKERWFEITVEPVLDAVNNLSGTTWVFSDITSQKRQAEKCQDYQQYLENKVGEYNTEVIHINARLQQEIIKRQQVEQENAALTLKLQEAQQQVEIANSLKNEFLAIVSHELRSPLTAILGWAKLIKNHKLDNATTTVAIDTIERNATIEAQLIDNLLDMSCIRQGKLSLNITSVNLASVIGAVIDSAWFVAEAKSIQIQASISENLLISGDLTRLKQIIWQLVANAIKFTPVGGKVEIKLERQGSYAQLQVCDTGIGISPEFLPYIFERFRQADSSNSRKYGGVGLGLAIAQHLVELQGGNIYAQSAGVGQGSTFTVQLPLLSKIADNYKLEKSSLT